MTRLLARILLVAAIVAGAGSSRATSVLAPDFQGMVRRADLIFTGRVLGQRAEWRKIEGQRSIVTLVRFEVLGVHKGQAARSVELQLLGGRIGEAALQVDAMPKFHSGERVVLFVEQNGVNASPLVGFFHGKFNVLTDDTIAHHNGDPLRDVAEIGKARAKRAASPRAMSQEDFATSIRGEVKKAK